MSPAISRMAGEEVRVRLRDAPLVRRWMKGQVAKRLRQTKAGEVADSWVLRRRAKAEWSDLAGSLAQVTTVGLFIGHTKSGGSLLGAMLDAHPEVVMGDEVDLARLIRARIPGDAMLSEFVRSARREAMKGRVTARRLGGYSLEIGGWNQGSSEHPRVVGNSRPGPTTRYLSDAPEALQRIFNAFEGRRLVFLHVIRRPEDSIAAMVLRSGRDIVDAAQDHAQQCERLRILRDRLGDAVHATQYESLVDDCRGSLGVVLQFLGIEPPPSYLTACSELVDHGLVPESTRVSWNAAAMEIIESSVQRFDFLAPYRS